MRIKLKYADVETFIQKYAINISRGGIFISTRTPRPIGTLIKFEFLLAGDESHVVIRGEGQVQWTKEYDPALPQKAHGMGIRFTRLDPDSQEVVDRALAWRATHHAAPARSEPHLVEPESTAEPEGRETRSIVIPDVEDYGGGRAPDDHTRPIQVNEADDPLSDPEPTPVEDLPAAIARAVQEEMLESRRNGRELDVDALASEWGVSQDKLAQILERTLRGRARIAEATAELERLLLNPPRSAPPTKAEALARMAELLSRSRRR